MKKLSLEDIGQEAKEKEILEKLTEAWRLFLQLERYHPDEVGEFGSAIHQLQHLIGMRFLNRERPDIFPKKVR